jgi:RNA polymerase sigma factor (sigma-70 family)
MSGDVAALVTAAAGGDQSAWNALVARYNGLVWSVASSFRLAAGEDADAVQNTWLRLVECLDRIHDPEHLGAWLATTCRRECLQVLRRRRRTGYSTDTDDLVQIPDDAPELDAALLEEERDAELWRVFAGLPEPCRGLLRVLMATPPPSYAEVSAALGLPVGSIGPTRQRCLGKLRELIAANSALEPTSEGGAP